MNKVTITIISILSILLCIFFFMWRDVRKDNANLRNDLHNAQVEIANLNTYNIEKDKELKKIKNKYNQVIGSYEGTDCENQKVSLEMIEALKAIRDAND